MIVADLPGNRFEIVPLAKGWRVDLHAEHTGEKRCIGRDVYPEEATARTYAAMLQRATGDTIFEAGKPPIEFKP